MIHSLRSHLRPFLFSVVLLVSASHSLPGAEPTELTQARAKLLELYETGHVDADEPVKRQRDKIAALEYIARAKPTAAEPDLRVVNVDFSGGPASALVAIINQDKNGGLNIIGEKSDLAIELPPFSIRNADGGALAGALDNLLRQRGYVLQGSNRPAPGRSSVFVLRKLSPHEIPTQGGNFMPFQLADHLTQQSVDDIVGAIRAAWELDPANSPSALRLKFHPATGILLVSGPGHGIEVVRQVLSKVRTAPKPNLKPETPSTPEKR